MEDKEVLEHSKWNEKYKVLKHKTNDEIIEPQKEN